eukprot:4642476-Lingulodinium_polyedra.AAC.1
MLRLHAMMKREGATQYKQARKQPPPPEPARNTQAMCKANMPRKQAIHKAYKEGAAEKEGRSRRK